MKLYSLNRLILFQVLALFPAIQLHHAGQLFASGFVPDRDAEAIRAQFPTFLSEYR